MGAIISTKKNGKTNKQSANASSDHKIENFACSIDVLRLGGSISATVEVLWS